MKRDAIHVNDRQLACAKISSQEGQDYLKSMSAAANFAWVNRASMTFLCRQVFIQIFFFVKIKNYVIMINYRPLPSSSAAPRMTSTCTSFTTFRTTSPKWSSTWWTENPKHCSFTEKYFLYYLKIIFLPFLSLIVFLSI